MIFKNARIFRFTKPVQVTPERLDEALQGDAFQPCGPQDTSRQGWVAPLGKLSEQLVHAANGYMLICLQRQEKLLPSSVINDYVSERVDAIEHEQSRKVRRKEITEIKEQVVRFVVGAGLVSISGIQRKFKIGYNRSANLVDAMEQNGVVSAAGHNGGREVLVTAEEV